MTSEILRCSTDGYFGFIDFDTNIAPFGKRVKIHTSLDERLGQLFSSCLESVSSDGQGSLSLIGLKELDQLSGVQKVQEVGNEFEVVAVILMNEVFEFLEIVFS